MAEQKSKMIKYVLYAAIGLLIVGSIGYSSMRPVPARTATAKKGLIRAYIEEQAKTALPRVYEITMPQDGRVLPILLEPGSAVKKGEVVAEIDLGDLQDAQTEAGAMVLAMSNAVAASAAKIRASVAREDLAKWLWQAQGKLYADQKVSEQAMKEAERDYVETQVEAEQDQFLYHAMAALGAISRLFPIYVDRRLQWAQLTSPIDGMVLNRFEQNEKVLPAGSPLLNIGDPNELEITTDVLSEAAVAVRPGQAVDIYGPSIGDTPVKGTVKRVDPRGFTKLSSLGVEEQRVTVTIALHAGELDRLRQAGNDLGVDYRVRVRLYTASAEGAVIVPITSLFRGDGGQWELFVLRNGKADIAKVSVGLTNDQEAQIVDGLVEGETVLIAPDAGLKPGARIEPVSK